ncbi:MAG: rhodanese-like domain-containing protein [Oxalobacter sp.]
MEPENIIAQAKITAQAKDLRYAGDITLQQAWQLVKNRKAVIIDVRTPEEYQQIGHIPGSQLITWQSDTPAVVNPQFIPEIEKRFLKDTTLLLICRASKRSVNAAISITGYTITCLGKVGRVETETETPSRAIGSLIQQYIEQLNTPD